MDEAGRERRAFIWAHHPDRGGDPELFVAGLRALDADGGLPSEPLPRVVVVRRRGWLARLALALARRGLGKKAPRVR